jgi:hypothetical protein
LATRPVHLKEARLLRDRLTALAGTPDDSPRVGTDLIVVALLAAKLVAEVDHATVTSRYRGAYVTVAASSDQAVALDKAQYDGNAGPCLEALERHYPAAVPDIAATMTWSKFRDTAAGLDVRTSLSIPLFAGSGRTIATLNLYSHRPGAMATLTTAVWAAYDPASASWRPDALDTGGRELAAGLVDAVTLRGVIQRAVTILLSAAEQNAAVGFQQLRRQASDAGRSLSDTAAHIIERHSHGVAAVGLPRAFRSPSVPAR